MNNLIPFECNQFCDFCVRENCPNRPYVPTQATNNLYSTIKIK